MSRSASAPSVRSSSAGFELRNRIVMAPMTRSRAGADDEPTDMVVEYYRQRRAPV